MNRYTLLVSLILLQFAVILGMWLGPVRQAQAQIPDPAAQREKIIQELADSNARLDKIIDLLSGGKLQVQIVKPDENQGQ